jgi:hypothetical protein
MNAPACEKCLYFIKGPYVRTGRCTRYSVYRGRGKLVYDFADNVRLDANKCGQEGRLFVSREKIESRDRQEILWHLLEQDE